MPSSTSHQQTCADRKSYTLSCFVLTAAGGNTTPASAPDPERERSETLNLASGKSRVAANQGARCLTLGLERDPQVQSSGQKYCDVVGNGKEQESAQIMQEEREWQGTVGDEL